MFTNSIEQMLAVFAMYFYLKMKAGVFDRNVVMLTATITTSFMMRNTSPIGWVPLLALKVLFERALGPFLLAFLLVSLPIMATAVYLDSVYYTGVHADLSPKEWVFTSWNFILRNVLENKSEFFGTSSWASYIENLMGQMTTLLWPFGYYSMLYGHWRKQLGKGRAPYIAIYCIFTMFVLSLIPHKEDRFLVPIFPFMFIMTGESFASACRSSSAERRPSRFTSKASKRRGSEAL